MLMPRSMTELGEPPRLPRFSNNKKSKLTLPLLIATTCIIAFSALWTNTQSLPNTGGSLPDLPLSKYEMTQGAFDTNRILSPEVIESSLSIERPIGGGDTSTTFLLAIFSCLNEKEFDRRSWIRDTYLNEKDERSVADERICPLEEFKTQVNRSRKDGIPRQCNIPYTFVVGANPNRPTEHYDDEPLIVDPKTMKDPEDDITYLNIKENMEDGKSVSYFKWAATLAEEYGIDYVSKTDSDSVIKVSSLYTLVQQELPPRPYNRRMYGGVGWSAGPRQHLYGAGQFYFLSADLAYYVSHTLTHEERRELTYAKKPTEDLDMGTFVNSHPRPIKFVHLSQYLFWAHPKKTKEKWYTFWEDDTNFERYPVRSNILPMAHLCKSYGFRERNRNLKSSKSKK